MYQYIGRETGYSQGGEVGHVGKELRCVLGEGEGDPLPLFGLVGIDPRRQTGNGTAY